MWKFSNLNSNHNIWPPDVGQQQLNPNSLVFPTYYTNSTPSPGFGITDFISPLNSNAFKPANCSSGLNPPTPTKKFLVFDHSGDQKSLKLSLVATTPFHSPNQTRPSNSHCSNKHEEMHEDTEEINALLYSDSEFSFNSEEASTGHSPLNAEEETTISPIPAKRRKLDLNHSAIDESLIDTACSARLNSNDNAGTSFFDSGSKNERIQTIVQVLRRIIPGGNDMNTSALLDEAIVYLKSLKLQAKFLDATTTASI